MKHSGSQKLPFPDTFNDEGGPDEADIPGDPATQNRKDPTVRGVVT